MGQVSVLEERKPLCCSWAEKYFTLQSIRGIEGKSDLADGLEKWWAEQSHQEELTGILLILDASLPFATWMLPLRHYSLGRSDVPE